MKYPKFIMSNSKHNEYYFNLHAKNAEVILTSETYTSRQNCINGIAAVKINADADENYKRKIATDGSFYFTLASMHNGEILGISEMYETVEHRDLGIAIVKQDAILGLTEDRTL